MNTLLASNGTRLEQFAGESPNTSLPASETFPAGRTPKLEKLCRLCRKNRRGTAVVEFAIVAPIFFLLVFGMIEYGRMVMVQQVITNASREGARQAVLDGATASSVSTSVTSYLTGASITGASVTTNPADPSSAGYGQGVTVTVSVPFSKVSWLPTPMFPINKTKTLSAVSVMRRESVQ